MELERKIYTKIKSVPIFEVVVVHKCIV